MENLTILSSEPFVSSVWQAHTAESRMIFRLDLVIVLQLKKKGKDERKSEWKIPFRGSWNETLSLCVRDEKKDDEEQSSQDWIIQNSGIKNTV